MKITEENKIKYSITIIIIACVTIVGFLLSDKGKDSKAGDNVADVVNSFPGVDISSSKEITCKYNQTVGASYSSEEIAHYLPFAETNPIISTFSELNDPEFSVLSSIDATQTITTYPLVKLVDDESKYIFLDSSDSSYLTTHTIYKNTGISTYTKNTDFFGVAQSVTSAMGTCVGY